MSRWDKDIHSVVRILKREIKSFAVPVVGIYAETRDPFLVLISTILSLRTKDKVTAEASERLFAEARTPSAVLALPLAKLERLIYPVCFYRVKSRSIQETCRKLLDEHGGKVPDTMEGLLALKGVGRKTANLTLTLGHGKPGICVDIHVHRISNRLGYVRTKSPDETETELRKRLPKQYWMIYNDLLVPYGQNLCAPVSPWCSRCRLARYCERRGVARSR